MSKKKGMFSWLGLGSKDQETNAEQENDELETVTETEHKDTTELNETEQEATVENEAVAASSVESSSAEDNESVVIPAELEEVEAFLSAIHEHDDVQEVYVALEG